jgi:hypothetical protein
MSEIWIFKNIQVRLRLHQDRKTGQHMGAAFFISIILGSAESDLY